MRVDTKWARTEHCNLNIKMDQPCFIGGINLQIYDWLNSTELFRKPLLLDDKLSLNDYLLVLGLKDDGDKNFYATELIGILWGAYPQLGPLPFIDTLLEMQNTQIFYSEYRDHLRHSLQVMLLGLYVYERNTEVQSIISSALSTKIQPEAPMHIEFFLRWLVTSIFHDIGYVAENDATTSGGEENAELKTKLLKEFNDYLSYPISKTGLFTDILEQPQEREYFKSKPFDNFIHKFEDIPILNGTDLFEDFDDIGETIGIGNMKPESSILTRYFELARTHHQDSDPAADRAPFLDHGVVSSGLLLRLHANYMERIEALSEQETSPVHKKIAEGIIGKKDATESIVKDAAAAIAFHNINVKWKSETYLSRHLFPANNLKFRFSGISALSFFLRYIDALQDYDRPLYRVRKKEDLFTSLSEFDIYLEPLKDRVLLAFRPDLQYADPETNTSSRFHSLRKELLSFLDEGHLSSLYSYKINAFTSDNEITDASASDEENREDKEDETFDFDDFKLNPGLMEKVGSIIGQTSDLKSLKLHKCRNNIRKRKVNCVYHLQTLVFISELHRNIDSLGETCQFIEIMDEISDKYENINQLTTSKKNFDFAKSELQEFFTICLPKLSRFFVNLKRDYPDDNWSQRSEFDCLSMRLEKYLEIRTNAASNAKRSDFRVLVMDLYATKDKDIYNLSDKDFAEYYYKDFNPKLKSLVNLWKEDFIAAFYKLKEGRIYKVAEIIADHQDNFRKLSITELTNGSNLPFLHLTNAGPFKQWKASLQR